jgi:hypothetical protein
MFSWIPSTFSLVRRNFGAMAVATIITLLGALLMMVPMVVVMFHSLAGLGAPGVPLPQDMTPFFIAYGVGILVGLLLMPPLLAGWFRLCAAADRGESVSGAQILAPYREGDTWLRLVVYALLALISYVVVLAVLLLPFHGLFNEMLAMSAAQHAALATGGQPPPPSFAMIGQIMLLYVVVLPTMFVLQFIYMVGFAEVSLRPTSPVRAFADAAGGMLRNLLKLLLLMICVGMGAGAVIFAVMLVVMLLGAVLSLIPGIGPIFMVVLMLVFELVLMLLIYPLMFGGHYYVWKGMLGDETPPALPA